MAGISGLTRAADVSELYAPRPVQRFEGGAQRSGTTSGGQEDSVSLSEQAIEALGGGRQLSQEQVKEVLALQSVKLAGDAQKQLLDLLG